MTKHSTPSIIGIDVSKHSLSIACSDTDVITLENQRQSIQQWLKSLPPQSYIALEATGIYHRLLMTLAHKCGHILYLLDGFKLSRYRDSIGGRAKTDHSDALLIRRYLLHEQGQLTPWTPLPKGYERLQMLMKRRATLVQARCAILQSLRDVPELKAIGKRLNMRIKAVELLLEKRMMQCSQEEGCTDDIKRCQGIEGVGPLTALALSNTYRRGHFSNSDAFVAFVGLDVRVSDSGQSRGRRRLSKKGDAEFRRLIYNAAMSARRSSRWQALYQSYIDRGLKSTQALLVLARKLVRIAFSLMKNKTQYQPGFSGFTT